MGFQSTDTWIFINFVKGEVGWCPKGLLGSLWHSMAHRLEGIPPDTSCSPINIHLSQLKAPR